MCVYIYIYIYIYREREREREREDRDSSVGIATRYRLEGPGVEFRCGRDFSHRSPVTQPTVYWVPDLFPGGKEAGAWRWPLTSIYRRC